MGYFNSSPLQVRTEVQGGRRDTNCILFRFKLAPVCSQSEHCNEVQLRPFLLLHLKCEPHCFTNLSDLASTLVLRCIRLHSLPDLQVTLLPQQQFFVSKDLV